jgi:hypothetical protein
VYAFSCVLFNNTQDIHGPAFDLHFYSPTLLLCAFVVGRTVSKQRGGTNKNIKLKKEKKRLNPKTKKKDE